MSKKLYYVYDHHQQDWRNKWIYESFDDFMNFMENSYDKERHSVHDTLKGHLECCRENDCPIERGC